MEVYHPYVDGYYTLTMNGVNNAWVVSIDADSDIWGVNKNNAIRPTIYINSNSTIVGGNGTMSKPYKVKSPGA